MITDLKKAKDKVEFIMQRMPESRDCDKTLWLAYLNTFHNLKKELGHDAYETFKRILLSKDTPHMASVWRMRQKFQEKGLYIGTKRKHRLNHEPLVREYVREL